MDLVFGVARANAAPVLVIELAQAGGHFAAARAGRGDDHDGTARLDIIVAPQTRWGIRFVALQLLSVKRI